jgi:hypothetical protein
MKKTIFGLLLIIAICFAFIACDDDDEDDYQGTYNVYGYYNGRELLPWDTLTHSSFDTLKESAPTKFVLDSNSIIITGGLYDGRTFSARINGNILYVTIDGTEITMGIFVSGDFCMTYGLDYASEGAYVLYKK